ncbi:MAG TPA: GNAT family N-acetyltransferase [Polyangiaceae bacterium]|nr:GNAT family N-acetyltransferase [Polyangiaceae bacterium]
MTTTIVAGDAANVALLEAVVEIDAASSEALREPRFSIADEIARPFARVFAATHQGAASGFLLASAVADELHIVSVVVLPSHRRLGVGRALVRAALDHAEAARARVVLLEVRRTNVAAVRLYRGLGFVAVHLRPGYYADGEDAVEMAFAHDAAVLAAFDTLPDDV